MFSDEMNGILASALRAPSSVVASRPGRPGPPGRPGRRGERGKRKDLLRLNFVVQCTVYEEY